MTKTSKESYPVAISSKLEDFARVHGFRSYVRLCGDEEGNDADVFQIQAHVHEYSSLIKEADRMASLVR